MKTWRDLAIVGGRAAFDAPLHVGRPNILGRDIFLRRVEEILERKWLTNDGPFVKEFEQRLANFLGVKHCIVVCNATAALELTARALDLKGEVIVPAFTFIATAHALAWQGIEPVFCDLDEKTHNLDPEDVVRNITERTTAVLGVHVWGRACAVDELEKLTRERGLRLFFDAAHALGCTHRGIRIGGFGEAEIFSFHATKILNTFEGGAIATNHAELADKLRLMRNFGFVGYDRVDYLGINGKMSEPCAAMGLTLLEHFDELVETNRRNYHAYRCALGGIPGVQLLSYDDHERNNYQYVVCEILPTCPLTRDELIRILMAENVIARRYFYPGCHKMEPYKSLARYAGLKLTRTDTVASRVLILPTGTSVTAEMIEVIAGLIREATVHAEDLRTAGALA